MNPDLPTTHVLPMHVRITLAHAAVQTLADEAHCEVLHIKGAALDISMRHPDRQFTDVDVLVRPGHVDRFLGALGSKGWTVQTSFRAGSASGHAATLHHDWWGYLDLHRDYPGFGPTPQAAFETLWDEREHVKIGGIECATPELAAQALVVLLHAARTFGPKRDADTDHLWTHATSSQRRSIRSWVSRLEAEVGFSVIEGRLEEYREHPDYDLWRVWSQGGNRLDEWRARVRSERSWRGKVTVMARAPLVNVEHLAALRGHPVTAREVVKEFFARMARGAREMLHRRRGR